MEDVYFPLPRGGNNNGGGGGGGGGIDKGRIDLCEDYRDKSETIRSRELDRQRTSLTLPNPLAKGNVINNGTKNTDSYFANNVEHLF
jgi:hypothetical protein